MTRQLWTVAIILGLTTTRLMAAPAPPGVAKTVTFIFLADEQGNPRIYADTRALMVNGTGFFVLVENKNDPGLYGYLVTAKHVLQDERGQYFRRVVIRINDKKMALHLCPSICSRLARIKISSRIAILRWISR